MKTRIKVRLRRATRVLMPIVIGACWLPLACAATSADSVGAQSVDAQSVAHGNWLAAMAQNTGTAEGCFHAAYPSATWEPVECKIAHPRFHPVHRKPEIGASEVTGNGNDYVVKANGLISKTFGSFRKVTGVKTEASVGVAAFGNSGILGPNEYTLQINSDMNSATAVCKEHGGCTVWQQFIYSPDYNQDGEAAVFMQYWLIEWGSSRCPSGWSGDGADDCYKNSAYVAAPDMPIKSLSKLTLSGTAVAGGNDTIVFDNGTDAYSITGKDSILDIATVWRESEFNIVGNAGGSRAEFNSGSSLIVGVSVSDGSSMKPTCLADFGTTGETNNLILRKCDASSNGTPYIEFAESN
jgi:hypothetical protein